jgi:hypothetical protein
MDVPATINKIKEQYITTQHKVKDNLDGSQSIFLTTELDKPAFTAALEQQLKLDGAFANNLKMNARRNGVAPDMNAIVTDIAATSSTPSSRVIETKNWDDTSKQQYAQLVLNYGQDQKKFPLEITRLELTNAIATIEKDMATINLQYLPQEKKMKYDQDAEQLKILKANADTQKDMNMAQLNQMLAQTKLIAANTAARLDETAWRNKGTGWGSGSGGPGDPALNPIIARLHQEGQIKITSDVAYGDGLSRDPINYKLFAQKDNGTMLNINSSVVRVNESYLPHFRAGAGETNLTYSSNTGFATYEVFLTQPKTGDLTVEKWEKAFNKEHNSSSKKLGVNKMKAEGGVVYFLDQDVKTYNEKPIRVGTYISGKRQIGKDSRGGVVFIGQGYLKEFEDVYKQYYNKKK